MRDICSGSFVLRRCWFMSILNCWWLLYSFAGGTRFACASGVTLTSSPPRASPVWKEACVTGPCLRPDPEGSAPEIGVVPPGVTFNRGSKPAGPFSQVCERLLPSPGGGSMSPRELRGSVRPGPWKGFTLAGAVASGAAGATSKRTRGPSARLERDRPPGEEDAAAEPTSRSPNTMLVLWKWFVCIVLSYCSPGR